MAYYEWRRGCGRIAVDFAVWKEDVGRFALQAKGGHYRLVDGEWHLRTRRRLMAVDASPLDEAWLGTLDLHDDIAELAETSYNPFVTAVLAFPDPAPDTVIMTAANESKVPVFWGREDQVRKLVDALDEEKLRPQLSGAYIEREV